MIKLVNFVFSFYINSDVKRSSANIISVNCAHNMSKTCMWLTSCNLLWPSPFITFFVSLFSLYIYVCPCVHVRQLKISVHASYGVHENLCWNKWLILWCHKKCPFSKTSMQENNTATSLEVVKYRNPFHSPPPQEIPWRFPGMTKFCCWAGLYM